VDLAAGTADPIVTEFGGAESVSWSADGSRLAFSARADVEEGPSQVYQVRTDGSELAALTELEAGTVTGLVWNPGGETLVFGLTGPGESDPEAGLHEIDPGTGVFGRTLPGENLRPIGFDATGEFLAFENGADLAVWVIAFGQVLPGVQGGGGSVFIGFVGVAE
jgi:dipeptidyl aminopeptidase/acylaminoacyl peptidase